MGISIAANGSITQTSTPGVSGAGADAEQRANFNSLNPGTPTPNIINSQMSLASARAEADQAFSGMVSPMSVADIKARQAEQQAASLNAANSQYNPQIDQTQKAGMATVSTAEGVTGQRQGFNISTAESAYLSGIQQEVVGRVKDVENQKAAAIQSGDLAAISRADEAIAKLNDYNNQLVLAKANYALQIMSGNREQAQLDLATQQASLQANKDAQTLALQKQELALNAYKTAVDTPVGKEFVVDGKTYVGLKDVSGIDPSLIEVSTDDKGFEVGRNKLTGQVLWKSTTATGKTKTAAASVSINMPNMTTQPGYSVSTGQQYIWRTPDKDVNGNVTLGYFTDTQGNKLDPSQVPADIKIGTFGAGNPTPKKYDKFGFEITE